MEIEVGEYVRLARNQGINKIIEIEDDTKYVLDEMIVDEYGDMAWYIDKNKLKDEVIKYSKNLIDLIEVGDYVNGFEVADFYLDVKTKERTYCSTVIGNFSNKEIKSIVTKEQFKSVEYRLEE